jgi:hypothetical protein
MPPRPRWRCIWSIVFALPAQKHPYHGGWIWK